MKIRRNEIMRQREICSRLPLCSPSFWSHFCFFHPFRLFFSPLVLHITHYELRRTNRNKLMITEEDAINFVFCKIDTRVFANFVINLKAIILTLYSTSLDMLHLWKGNKNESAPKFSGTEFISLLLILKKYDRHSDDRDTMCYLLKITISCFESCIILEK